MTMRPTLLHAILTGVFVAGWAAPAAAATICGTAAPGAEPARGALELRTAESEPDLDFGRDTEDRKIILEFDVSGCLLAESPSLRARTVASTFPDRALSDSVITPKGNRLSVEIPVRATFKPGEYKLFVKISGNEVDSTTVPATVKRTEHRELIPLGIWLAGVVIGFLWAVYTVWLATKEGRARTRVKVGYFPLAIVAAFGAAIVPLKQSYYDANVWRLGLGTVLTLLFTSAAAAAGGSTTGPLAKAIYRRVRKLEP